MRSLLRNNSSWFVPVLLLVSVLWLGVFGVIAMNHGGGMHMGCPMDFIGSGNSAQPMSSSFCATVHMGMMQELFNAIPGTIDLGALLASVAILATILSLGVLAEREGAYALCRVRYRDKLDKDPDSFFSRIKTWISLRREDPAFCLA